MKKLVAPRSKPIVLAPVRPNAGTQARYEHTLNSWIDQMHKSVAYWISATWRANTPHAALAHDESPAKAMQRAFRSLSGRWLKRINNGAPKLAKWFAGSAAKNSDDSLKRILRDSGFSVKFTMSRAMNDSVQAIVGENVGLIKSIGSQHMSKVEQLVNSSVHKGRDLASLNDELLKIAGVSKSRAALISRDQNNKITSALTKLRHKELGLTKAQWKHSKRGIHPRESHEEADGEIYNIDEGCEIDGEFIQPGELIGCNCVSMPIIPGLDDDDE